MAVTEIGMGFHIKGRIATRRKDRRQGFDIW
jgi:hypothetical protein